MKAELKEIRGTFSRLEILVQKVWLVVGTTALDGDQEAALPKRQFDTLEEMDTWAEFIKNETNFLITVCFFILPHI